MRTPSASWMLAQEARGLLARLGSVRPFALQDPMVPAAAISPEAQAAVEHYLARGRRVLRARVHRYLDWLAGEGAHAAPAYSQHRFTILKLGFNAVLAQFDIFAEVLLQRGEHGTGTWLAGLDAVADDALRLPLHALRAPPIVCYLDRSPGGAIRRARTRLPGGGANPVAIIRVPRERMVGSGVASSLVHEVGHQGSALLGLPDSLRPILHGMQRRHTRDAAAWRLWERWLSEILADFWAIARVGAASTLGLIGLVSLPRAFVFRPNLDDPHPTPWIRVKLSCAIGNALYPHPQWASLARLWEAYYPTTEVPADRLELLHRLEASIPGLVPILTEHRPRALQGRSLREVLSGPDRRPEALRQAWRVWRARPSLLRQVPPTRAFAALGQARLDGIVSPEEESRLLGNLLTFWALRRSIDGHRARVPQLPALAAA